MIGGQISNDVAANNQCLQINTETQIVRKRRSMPENRAGFGVCLVSNFIYVTGGISSTSEIDRN